jgi:hypothetical protein
MLQNFKNRRNQMAQQQAPPPAAPTALPAVDNTKLNTMNARVQALEVKLDKIINHFGVK